MIDRMWMYNTKLRVRIILYFKTNFLMLMILYIFNNKQKINYRWHRNVNLFLRPYWSSLVCEFSIVCIDCSTINMWPLETRRRQINNRTVTRFFFNYYLFIFLKQKTILWLIHLTLLHLPLYCSLVKCFEKKRKETKRKIIKKKHTTDKSAKQFRWWMNRGRMLYTFLYI